VTWTLGIAVAACSLNVNYNAGGTDGGTQAPAPNCTTAVGAGFHHTCAIRSDGTAWCWGSNSAGQLGNGVQRTVAPVAPLLACPK
jgi:alpha-tubulin suppressor-like RCC1 family protein